MTRTSIDRDNFIIHDDFEPEIKELSKVDREAKRDRALVRMESIKNDLKTLNVSTTHSNLKYGIIIDEHVWIMSQDASEQPYRHDGVVPTREEMKVALQARKLALGF